MKKIFTLFIATVVAMSMMALPQNVKLAGKKEKPASKEQFEAKTPAQAKVKDLHMASVAERNFARPEVAKKVPATLPLKGAKKVAAAQTADTIKWHFNGFSVAPEWYEESGDWYMACSEGNRLAKFDILNESYVGTFTEEDMDLYYSYILNEYDDYVDYEKVALTISEEKVGQYLTTIKLHAVIDGSDGNVYVVTCDHATFTPKAEVSHKITGATLTFDEWEGLVTLAGKNADLDVTLAYLTTWPTGRYTKGDFDMEATKVTYKGAEQQVLDVEMLVSSDVVDGTLAYVADVNYYDQDTVLNHVSVTAPVAAATDTVEITISNLQVDDSWASIFGWVYLTGASSEWDIYAGVAGYEAEEGEWAGEDEVMLYVTDKTTGIETEAIYATATMVNDDELGWMVYLEGQCKDGVYYVVEMKFEIPEPTSTVTLSFPNSASAAFYPDLSNDLYLANQNDEYFVALDIYGVPMGGEFTYDDMDQYYTQLVKWGETEDDFTEIQIASVEGKVYQTGDTTWMVADVVGFDAILYQVELWYVVPTPQETVNLTVEATFDNQLEANGYYTLSGVDEATGLLVAMSPITEEVAGTFVNDGVFGRFGEGQYDFYANYTYVAKYIGEDEWGDPQYDVYSIEKGTLTVTVDEEENIVATASVICSNAVQYEITMTSKVEKPHLEYDAQYGITKEYTADDIVYAEYDADYGMVYWQVEAADGSDICALYVFVEEADDEIVIPEGTYSIDDSMDYGTVYASTGYDPYNGVSPSVYATYYAENPEYLDELWFMVGGTVTVEKVDGKMKMTINAINSYDQVINIVYDGTATGGSVGELYYDVITNMSIDLENMVIYGGPSNEFGVEVVLGLAEDNMDGSFTLSPESYVTILNGEEVTFIDGIAYEIDAYAPSALVDLVVDWNGTILQFHLEMSAVTNEAVVIEVYDAKVEVGQVELFDGVYDYTLTMTADWTDADGVTYPVLVEVPVYYPEATEPYDMLATVTVGGWADEDPWLGFGEGYVTVSTVDDVVTVQGLIENPGTGFAADITIAGKLETTALENVTTATFEKVLKNGQLIIIKNGVEYNAQGAIVK